MKVYCSEYSLTPKKQANRTSTPGAKGGVYLKAILKDRIYFADYFPHESLGDRSVELFLQEFKFQDHEYDRKVFDLLLRDVEFQKLNPKKYFNHQLWSSSEDIKGSVVKYKIHAPDDFGFMRALEKNCTVRLDANGLFTRSEFATFLKDIPLKHQSRIEYVEDPLQEADWKNLGTPTARDFIEGEPFDYLIYKPNCEFLPKTEKKVIFSSYLGGNLGRWHSYAEMIQKGDLTLYHGIKTEGFYTEETDFFTGSYKDGFIADMGTVNRIYKSAADLNWKELCSM